MSEKDKPYQYKELEKQIIDDLKKVVEIKEIDDYAIQPRHRAWLENVWCWDSEFSDSVEVSD